ncbi:MAG TPA: holo-[acyl-carrier-protein] synthase [Treponema sp.]|nr:holo-[acyl-carrier-protein] synthase [Treponema sp.]
MIYGIGTDIAKVSRFEKWALDSDLTDRFFNSKELFEGDAASHLGAASRHYAARFAAKEAFAKALGTGFTGLCLSDFYVAKDERGKPYFVFGDKTKKILDNSLANYYNIQLSLSHENEFAVAFVVIEKGDN